MPLISTRKEMHSHLSHRIKGFYCAAKRNKNSLRGEKISHPTKDRGKKKQLLDELINSKQKKGDQIGIKGGLWKGL